MKVTKYAAIAAMGLLALTSCSEDQSTFDVQDIPGRCLIQGEIKYNEGTTRQGSGFVYNYKPAENLQVTLTVDNSSYGNLSGQSTFTTFTDAQGKYSIEIPAVAQNANVRITTADFRGIRSVITEENNQIVTKNENVIYRGQTSVSAHSQGIVYANIICSECNVNTPITGLTEQATLKGRIGQGVEYRKAPVRNYDYADRFIGYTNATLYYVYEGAKADLIVTVNYKGDSFTYNTTTDNSGYWTLQVPVSSFPATFSYSVKAMPYNSKYTHYERVERTVVDYYDRTRTYYDYEGHTLDGFYDQSFSANYTANFPVAAQVVSYNSKVMLFQPYNNGQDTYGYSSSMYSSSGSWLSDLLNSFTD